VRYLKDLIFLKRVSRMSNTKQLIKELIAKDNYTFNDLCNLVSVLRSDDGCPWDREQTNKSIRNSIIDETYEFIEGLDDNNDGLMCEELGDVLFQIIFHSDIKSDNEAFDINDVINGICKKMILRHPHVFGDVSVSSSSDVLVNWENIKNSEKQRKTPYEQLDSVSKALPSLMRAQKLISKAEKNNLVEKSDLSAALNGIKKTLEDVEKTENVHFLGKLLFDVSALCRVMDVEAEEILYIENNKFINQFKD